ncbi:uncharacterized protein LOC143449742 isoform X2 [Clavelina lepadiformis]
MDVYRHMNSTTKHFGNMIKSSEKTSEFQSDAYLEYRRRVFQQLAAEYEREKRQQEQENEDEDPNLNNDDDLLHSSCYQNQNDDLKCTVETQPSWDDSDLKSETYITSPVHSYSSHTLPWQKNSIHKSDLTFDDQHRRSTNELNSKETSVPLMNWASFEEQIKRKSGQAESNESIQSNTDSQEVFPTAKQWKGHKNSFQKQKMEREAIRQKLSMENNDHEEFKYGADKPWYQPRFERSYSANNQSLQICYINESCSSGSDDEVSKLEKSDSSRNSSFSPASPMGFGSPRLYGKRYMKQHRSSDVSSHSSSTSSLTMPSPSMASDSTIISHNHHQDLRSGRSKQEELEMEARFQLAQAHQRAKLQAEEDRQKSRTQDKSSLAHRLLSVTLTDDINAKMKSYSLSRQDCQRMTLGQLQLILNDMHSKKQGLNDKLMGLLLARDDLQTEQDAKLVDVEDAKAVMNAVGPETTV